MDRAAEWVVSYLVSTSNHNIKSRHIQSQGLFLILYLHQTTTAKRLLSGARRLFLILYLHQTTTSIFESGILHSCFLSCIYIKPQPRGIHPEVYYVVSYLVSTSNHNVTTLLLKDWFVVSYLVSTSNHNIVTAIKDCTLLFLILYLHQTTTPGVTNVLASCCFLSCIYIKPQQ